MKNLFEEHTRLIAASIMLLVLIVGCVIACQFFAKPRDSTDEGSTQSTTSADKKANVTVGEIKKESNVKNEEESKNSTAEETLDVGLGSSVSVPDEQNITAQTLADNPPKDVTPSTADPVQATTEIPLEKIEFVVTDISIDINEVGFLNVAKTPYNAADTGYIFKSSDNSIVTVDESGKITALKTGETTITATAKSNEKLKAQTKVTVTTSYN